VAIAQQIRSDVYRQEGLTCSVGVAAMKFIAKLASEAAKPRAALGGPQAGAGVVEVPPGEELAFLHPLPVQALWGVGPATLTKLERLGVKVVGDLAALPVEAVVGTLGQASGRHLHALAHAIDPRPVVTDLEPKSVGHEETFARDHHRHDTLQPELVRMADAVASRLREHRLAGRTVTVKIRFHDFRTITRSTTLPEPVDSGAVITRSAKELLAGVDPEAGVRLLGVSVSHLDSARAHQLSFDDAEAADWPGAEAAVDAVRARFGADAVGPASLTGPGGLRTKRRGDQQWGPDEDGSTGR
jgi:DNA polymerase-4